MTTAFDTTYFDRLILIKDNPKKKLAVLGLGVENWQFIAWAIQVIGIEPSQFILIDQRESLVIPSPYAELGDFSNTVYVGGLDYLKWFLRLIYSKIPH